MAIAAALAVFLIAFSVVIGCEQSSTMPTIEPPDPLADRLPIEVRETIDRLRNMSADIQLSGSAGAPVVSADLRLVRDSPTALALLGRIPGLQRLDLESQRLQSKDFDKLKDMSDLRWLNLSNTQFGDSDAPLLPGLKRLEFLLLWGAPIGDRGIASICGLQNLRKLDLSGTRITEAGLARLDDLPNLQELYVEVPAVSDSAMRELHVRFPQASIAH